MNHMKNAFIMPLLIGLASVSSFGCHGRSEPGPQGPESSTTDDRLDTHWKLIYSFDRASTMLDHDGARDYIWIDIHGDGRVAYNETNDGADSNASHKALRIDPRQARQIRDRVTSAVGELLWYHPLEYEHLEHPGLLHGHVQGRPFQMPVPSGIDSDVREALEPLLVLAAETEWTYDMYGRHRDGGSP